MPLRTEARQEISAWAVAALPIGRQAGYGWEGIYAASLRTQHFGGQAHSVDCSGRGRHYVRAYPFRLSRRAGRVDRKHQAKRPGRGRGPCGRNRRDGRAGEVTRHHHGGRAGAARPGPGPGCDARTAPDHGQFSGQRSFRGLLHFREDGFPRPDVHALDRPEFVSGRHDQQERLPHRPAVDPLVLGPEEIRPADHQ